jgi:hypothetical protein
VDGPFLVYFLEETPVDVREFMALYARVKAFVKGPSGGGKTYLAASASRLWKTFFIDVEGGLISAFSAKVCNPENLTPRLVRQREAVDFFADLGDAVAEAQSGKHECVVVDSLTEIAGRMEDEYAALKEGTVDIQHWFKLVDRVKRLSRRLRDLPCHTIVTALTKPTGKDEGKGLFEPVLPGTTAAVVPSFFDVTGLMRRGSGKKTNFEFVTDGPSLFAVRDRWNALRGSEDISKNTPHALWEKLWNGIQSHSTPIESEEKSDG